MKYDRGYPEAISAISNNHYMNDYLGSGYDEAELRKTDVNTPSGYGGSEIREWTSSSPPI